MSGYDFIVDTAKLSELLENLNSYYEKLSDDIAELRSFFAEGTADSKWSGQAYNDLKNRYDTSAKSYDAVLAYLSAYKSLISKVEDSASALCSNVASACR